MSKAQHSQIADFLSRFTLTQSHPNTILIQSHQMVYLSKCIQIDSNQTDVDNVLETLQQHQTLNQTYLLTLLNYTITPIPSSTLHIVRTLYQYAKMSLEEEIINRRAVNQYFTQEELWAIIYSVTKSLEYLERLNIGYGVLGCDKIFIDKKIKLLDPSAVAEDPLTLVPHRLYSPEIINQHSSVNILKSDVFVLGLCILEAALLVTISNSQMPVYDQIKLKLYLDQLEGLYDGELAHLIKQMIEYSPEDRPSFSQIREYLQSTLEMADSGDDYFNPLPLDAEDNENVLDLWDCSSEVQVCDLQEQDERNSSITSSLNEYQKAKMRFLSESISGAIKELSSINEDSRFSGSLLLETNNGQMDKKKVSKCIKDKLVKKITCLDLQVQEVRDYRKSNYPNGDINGHNNLFTSPRLLEEIQNELKTIARNRINNSSKENLYSGNY